MRMNPLDTPWGLQDLESHHAAPAGRLRGAQGLDARGTDTHQRRDQPLGTSTTATRRTASASSWCPPKRRWVRSTCRLLRNVRAVVALSWGAEDLSAALGAPRNRRPDGSYLDVYSTAATMTLLSAVAGERAARGYRLRRLQRSPTGCAEMSGGGWMGYTGKITIHPNQIDIVNAAFSPGSETWTKRDAWWKHLRRGKAGPDGDQLRRQDGRCAAPDAGRRSCWPAPHRSRVNQLKAQEPERMT